MSLSPLIPIAGIAAGSLAAEVVRQTREGLSFINVFGRQDEPATSADCTGDGPFMAVNAVADQSHEQLQQMLESLRRELVVALGIAGIDTSRPIALQTSRAGGIVVDPSHPQAGEIERLLLEHPDLASEIRNVLQASASNGQLDNSRLVMHGDSLTFSAC